MPGQAQREDSRLTIFILSLPKDEGNTRQSALRLLNFC